MNQGKLDVVKQEMSRQNSNIIGISELTWTGIGEFNFCVLIAQSSLTLCDPMDCSPPGSSLHGNSPGKNTGVDCHFHLQGIFLTQGIKPMSPALQADSLLSELQESPEFNLDDHYIYYCGQEMKQSSQSTKESRKQYLGATSKMIE